MIIKELAQRLEITDIICDVCGNSCCPKNSCSCESISIDHHYGYGSEKDGVRVECDLCEHCFEKVKNFIVKELKGVVRETLPY